MMITLEKQTLVFRFPEVHEFAPCSITFQRTLRISDHGRKLSVACRSGALSAASHRRCRVAPPASIVKRGGVAMPMWQAEAMWIEFDSILEYPLRQFRRAYEAASPPTATRSVSRRYRDFELCHGKPISRLHDSTSNERFSVRVVLKSSLISLIIENENDAETARSFLTEARDHVFLVRGMGDGSRFVVLRDLGARAEACREPINLSSHGLPGNWELIRNAAHTNPRNA